MTSCNQLSKEVENSFSIMGVKLDSLNEIEENKIENLFNEINSERIKKNVGENSSMIYYSVIRHNRIVDSLINELKSLGENQVEKKKITDRFESEMADLNAKLNSIKEFNAKSQIDSLLKSSNDVEIMPNYAIISNFQGGKLNASKSAELLLQELKEKIKIELNKN